MVEEIKKILENLQKKTVEELASYDVKLEDEVLKKYIKENAESLNWPQEPICKLDPWQRMCYYQVSGSTGTDCDVALFTVVVYYLAYGLGEKGWKINEHKGGYHLEKLGERWELRGDTMNSYATPVIGGKGRAKGLLRRYFLSENSPKMEEDSILSDGSFVDKYQKFGKKKGDKYVWSAYMLDKWEDFISLLEDVLVKNKISKEDVYEYIRLNHTIGNFIPVPFISKDDGQFNSPRGIGETKDFWDLALLAIYHYYHKDFCKKEYSSFALRWLLGDVANVRLCQKWLDSFEGASGEEKWDTFVKQNFLQDFVEGEENGPYGLPKELWEGHFEGTVIPKEEKHYNKFFKNASERIEARGKKIAKKIKNELEGKDLAIFANKMVCG